MSESFSSINSLKADASLNNLSDAGKQRKLTQCKAPEVVLTLCRKRARRVFQPSTSCLTRGSAHRHLCIRSTSSATTSYLTIDELEDLRYLDALAALLSLLMDCAKEAEILDEEQINQLLDLFVAKLPDLWGKCLKQCA